MWYQHEPSRHDAPPKLLEGFKCKFKSENIKRRSWGMFLSLEHFGGKRGVLELQDGD
jgi:hypothetical protein